MSSPEEAIHLSLTILEFTESVLTEIRESCRQALAGTRTITTADVERLAKECHEVIEKTQRFRAECSNLYPLPPRVM